MQPGLMSGKFTPEQFAYIQALPPEQAAQILGQSLFKEPKGPDWQIEKVREGNKDVTYRIDLNTGTREKIGEGSAFAPQQPTAAPEKVRLAQAAGLVPGTPEYNKFLLGNAPDPAKDVETFAKINTMVKPYIDSAINMSKQVSQVNTALDEGNGTGDIAAIVAFNKLLDEGAVVRESDVALTLSAQSLTQQLSAWAQNKKEGEIMPPALRDKLRATTKAFYEAGNKYSKAKVGGYKNLAKGSEVDFSQIVSPELEQLLGWTAAPSSAPTPRQQDMNSVLGVPGQ
jgi:hypothetical protein